MRTRTKITVGVLVVAGLAIAVGVVYRQRTAGNAEVRDITERVAAAMAAGDRAALAAEPVFHDHPETVDWLVAKGPVLASGYRVYAQRNGENGYQLLDRDVVSHVGVIATPAGDVSLGFWRDRKESNLTFVTAAATLWVEK